tara:strand:- start:393 stop:944 length:552 start_codon:yes stop_codon:yes gene_type:complete
LIKKIGPLIVLMILSACDAARDKEEMPIPADLESLRQNALNCSRDVQWTHAERSEHCVMVAENIFADHQNECWESNSIPCLNWRLVHSDISLIYQGAIAESLFEHGKSDEMIEISENEFWREVYLNGKAMRSLFEQCIDAEERELKEVGLRKVSSLALMPLEDGQRCFRAGYPQFKTEPIRQS